MSIYIDSPSLFLSRRFESKGKVSEIGTEVKKIFTPKGNIRKLLGIIIFFLL